MTLLALLLATCFLAYSNGANDNFKGVASLFGCRAASYRTAISWATITTFAGSTASIFCAQSLLRKFSGKGLVPDALVASPQFLLAIALGAAVTVILAAWLGFPISTTHGLLGSILGCGLVAVGAGVNFSSLGKGFVLPLLFGPLIAIALGAMIYVIAHAARIALGITKEWCICIGKEERVIALPQPPVMALACCPPQITLRIDEQENCRERYAGGMCGLSTQQMMDGAHFLSAGVVSFARGLNDTPKIVALLLLFQTLDIRSGFFAVVLAMATGGLLNARKIAATMSHKLTAMNHGQGFCANLATGILVILASLFGLPVSTTHVSVGALFGIGLTTRQTNPRVMLNIALSWVITLPCAALIGGGLYALFKQI